MIDDDTDQDDNLENEIFQYTRKNYTHTITASLILFIGSLAAVGGIISLAGLTGNANTLLAIKPENRADTLRKNIALTRNKAEREYTALKAKMEADQVYTINKKFQVMYSLTTANNRDYLRMLSAYQQASFNIASRVRGSGEWYFYYERELNQFIKQQQAHEGKLSAYLASIQQAEP